MSKQLLNPIAAALMGAGLLASASVAMAGDRTATDQYRASQSAQTTSSGYSASSAAENPTRTTNPNLAYSPDRMRGGAVGGAPALHDGTPWGDPE